METSVETFLDILRAYPLLWLTGVLWLIVLLIAYLLKDFSNVTKKRPIYRAATLEEDPDAGYYPIFVRTGEYTNEKVPPTIARRRFIAFWAVISLLISGAFIIVCPKVFPKLLASTYRFT